MIPQDVVDGIRADLAEGLLSQTAIGAKWGVGQSAVSRLNPNKQPRAPRITRETPRRVPSPVLVPAAEIEVEPEPTPRVSSWVPKFEGPIEPLPPAKAKSTGAAFQAYDEPQDEAAHGPLAMHVMKLKIHVEKREFEPVRRLLADPDLRMLAAALVHADGKQWSAVERLVREYDPGCDPGLSLDSNLAEAGLPVRTVNYLEEAGFLTFHDLEGVPRSRLEAIRGFGSKMIDQVIEAMARAAANTAKLETAGERRGDGE